MNSYPHQISGGQQQRVVIAMALCPTPAAAPRRADHRARRARSSRHRRLIKEISAKFGTSMIYISHNLGLILETCHRITVMYSGEAVEVGSVRDVFRRCACRTRAACSPPSPCPAPTSIPAADRHPRPAAAAAHAPARLQFRPRCAHFVAGRCDAAKSR
jgi:peptide/nickel transport system ATP-binding protein